MLQYSLHAFRVIEPVMAERDHGGLVLLFRTTVRLCQPFIQNVTNFAWTSHPAAAPLL